MSTCPRHGKPGMHCAMPSACYLDDCPLRVQPRVNWGVNTSPIGSAPHHDRVFPIVLVMPGRKKVRSLRVAVVEPDSPHSLGFWQDIGRPSEGQERTAEAPEPDDCVQPACPTCEDEGSVLRNAGLYSLGRPEVVPCPDCADVEPIDVYGSQLDALRSTYSEDEGAFARAMRDEVDGAAWALARDEARANAQALAYRCNAFWGRRAMTTAPTSPEAIMAMREAEIRTDLIERIGPLPEPYPEEGT